MLGVETFDSRRLRATGQAIKWRIAFTQRDGVLLGGVRKELAEAPDAALVESVARGPTAEPESFQRRWVGVREDPSGEKKFQQVAASSAAEVLRGGIGSRSAGNAAQTRDGFGDSRSRQWGSAGGQRCCSSHT